MKNMKNMKNIAILSLLTLGLALASCGDGAAPLPSDGGSSGGGSVPDGVYVNGPGSTSNEPTLAVKVINGTYVSAGAPDAVGQNAVTNLDDPSKQIVDNKAALPFVKIATPAVAPSPTAFAYYVPSYISGDLVLVSANGVTLTLTTP